MDSQTPSNDVHTRTCTIHTRPVLTTLDGQPLLFLESTRHDFIEPALENNAWVQHPTGRLELFRVMPGYLSEMAVEQVLDGSPPTGTTSFDFSICYTAYNGLRQTDGREICEAVERLVARMVADRTWRRDFDGRDDGIPRERQQNGPETMTGEQKPEATAPTDANFELAGQRGKA